MKFVWEHNGADTLLYSTEHIGAYTRGGSLEAAIRKIPEEIKAYSLWAGTPVPEDFGIVICQEQASSLQIRDADSDVLFDTEKAPLSREEYETLKTLVMKSALDFHTLYMSISNKDLSCLPPRKTFYGNVPRTAREMYDHTKNVNAYYFGEIGIFADNDGAIHECRERGFACLEQINGFLDTPVMDGSYGECWSVRKVMRRFLWHDRIHAKAMYRMAAKTFGIDHCRNPFHFQL